MTTVALVIVTGILGASLARSQGVATLARFQTRMAAGELPHEDLLDGILILLAGAVLLTPGLITDTVGFLLLVPPVRRVICSQLVKRLTRRLTVVSPVGGPGGGPFRGPVGGPVGGPAPPPPRARSRVVMDDDVVDAEFEVKE